MFAFHKRQEIYSRYKRQRIFDFARMGSHSQVKVVCLRVTMNGLQSDESFYNHPSISSKRGECFVQQKRSSHFRFVKTRQKRYIVTYHIYTCYMLDMAKLRFRGYACDCMWCVCDYYEKSHPVWQRARLCGH